MFKKSNAAGDEDSSFETVVTETIETSDGITKTTTKTTVVRSGNISSSEFETAFKDFKVNESNSLSKKAICSTSNSKDSNGKTLILNDNSSKKSPKQSKSLSERLGLKPKSKESKSENDDSSVKNSVKPGKFEDDCLKSHNSYRSKHGVPPLKLSKQLCAYSKEWANHLAANDMFQHRTERKYGENIFMKWSSNPNHMVTGNEAVDSWYSEIKDYTFGKEPTTLKSGHFTQVIWKESSELGVAWARSSSGKILVVANYSPPGNFVGKFTENVPSPK